VRQSLVLSDNDPLIFLERPISATILGAAVLVGLGLVVMGRQRRSAQARLRAGEPAELVGTKGE
jgi:putative tricarboxylic transport membrane protein